MTVPQCQALSAGDTETGQVTAEPTQPASAVRGKVLTQSGVREVGPKEEGAVRLGKERGNGRWGKVGRGGLAPPEMHGLDPKGNSVEPREQGRGVGGWAWSRSAVW